MTRSCLPVRESPASESPEIFAAATTLLSSYNQTDRFRDAAIFRDAVSVLESDLLQQERPEHQLHVRPITGCNFLYETIPPSLPLLTSAAEIVQQAAEREPVGSEHLTSVRQVLEPPADQSAAELEDDLHVLSQI